MNVVVPAFADHHVHLIEGGLRLSRVQLRDAASPEEFARRIAEQAETLGAGKWITGGGWDEQQWQPYRLPSRQLIDDVTRDNPVFVSRLDIHMALANAVALRLAGITRHTPDPPGGTIVRDADGEPTGLLKDSAMNAVFAVIPPIALEERVAAARAALREVARFGITSICDMSSVDAYDDFRAYQQLEAEGALTARIALYPPIATYERLLREEFPVSNRLRIAGLKGFADGSLGSSTAAFFEPFDDEPDNRGLLMEEMTNGSMARWIADAGAHGLSLAIHAIGDRANDEVLRIFESRPNVRERGFRIEHAQHLNPDLIRRLSEDGITVSMQPYHAIDDGRWAETKIGRERARWAYAFRSLLDAGVDIAFGSDWPVAPLNPLLGIHAAVTRRTRDGRVWVPEERITVEEAMRCYARGQSKEDWVVLSNDPFTIDPEALRDVTVDMTVLGGEVIFER